MKKKIPRKPVHIYFGRAYVGFDDVNKKSLADSCLVYIGGRYYHSSAQIHLDTIGEIRGIGNWLLRAADFLESKKK